MESYFYQTVKSYLAQTKRLSHTHPLPPGGGMAAEPVRPLSARPIRCFRFQPLLFLILPLLATTHLSAQPTSTIPALFISDIHLDPYHDPAKVAKLNAAPAADWPAILAQPDSPTQPADSAALQKACPVRGVDTPNALWLSSLQAIHTNAAHAQFVTLSGDLLAHSFDCKFKTLLPTATHADYVTFTEKTIRYVVSSLRASLPGVPIYTAMGNNDSGCTDYALDPAHDEFLARIAKIVAETLPADLSAADRTAVLRDFATSGSYNVPLAAVPHTRLIVLDDLYLSARYATCSGKPDPAPAVAQLAWLESQLSAARKAHERVWVMGHIPPGVDPFNTIRNLPRVCLGGKSTMFLGSEALADVLARSSDIVRLVLFGHTHSDEMRLLSPGPSSTETATAATPTGVPVKIVPSITPVNGNRPTFTLASIDPATANLADFTVIEASNLTGDGTTWSPEYTYSTAYHQPAFDATSVSNLLQGFAADPGAKSAESQAYLRSYFPGDVSALIQFAWPQYTCAMTHDSGASFAACACGTASSPSGP
jgi:sphingomyelin phosphodiesterase acid-like 3